jgi:hypothetical protein
MLANQPTMPEWDVGTELRWVYGNEVWKQLPTYYRFPRLPSPSSDSHLALALPLTT